MKTIRLLPLLLLATFASAATSDKVVPGPKGGRLLEAAPQRAEFFVTKDRLVEVTFYDAALKPTAPTTQTVAITAEPKSGRTPVALEKTATGYISKSALPASTDPYRVVVQLRATPDAKPQNFRIDLNLDTCGECKRAEYACTCSH